MHAHRSEVPSKLHNLFCQYSRHFSDMRSLTFSLFHAASAHYRQNLLGFDILFVDLYQCDVHCVCSNEKSLVPYIYIFILHDVSQPPYNTLIAYSGD